MSISCGVCGTALGWCRECYNKPITKDCKSCHGSGATPCRNCARVEEIRHVMENLPTRRDLFAAAALVYLHRSDEDHNDVVETAFGMADLMEKAR